MSAYSTDPIEERDERFAKHCEAPGCWSTEDVRPVRINQNARAAMLCPQHARYYQKHAREGGVPPDMSRSTSSRSTEPDTHVRENKDSTMTIYYEYDGELISGTRRDPNPAKTFEDFEAGDVVPVPEYFGTETWILEGTRWSP